MTYFKISLRTSCEIDCRFVTGVEMSTLAIGYRVLSRNTIAGETESRLHSFWPSSAEMVADIMDCHSESH